MNTKQSSLGALIIVAGVIVLLANINVGSMRDIVAHWWPIVLVIAGGYMWWSNPRNYIWALAVAITGILLLVNTLGVVRIDVGDVIFPLILVAFGASVLVGSRRYRNEPKKLDSEEHISAFLGGVSSKNVSDDYRGGSVSAVMGAVELDISKVMIKKEASLKVWVLMGGVELRVPESVIVKSRVSSFLSGVEDKSQPTSNKNAPVLYLDGSVVMGGIEIKR